jgi:hypothetical protein
VNNTIIFIGDCNCHFHHYLPKTYFLLTLNPFSMTKTDSTILHILFYLLGICPFSRSIFVLLKMEPAMPCMACVHHISLSPSSQTPRCYSASLVLFPLERSKEIGCHPAKIWYHPSHLTRPFSSTPNPHPARTAGGTEAISGAITFSFLSAARKPSSGRRGDRVKQYTRPSSFPRPLPVDLDQAPRRSIALASFLCQTSLHLSLCTPCETPLWT